MNYHLNVLKILIRILFDLTYLFKKDKSQFKESSILKELLLISGGTKGHYLEIGSNLPVRFSNSYDFYAKGWSGLCIDAEESFKLNWKIFRKRDIFKNYLVTSEASGESIFYKFEERVNLVSTANLKFAQEWEKRGFQFKSIKLKSKNILELYQDFIQIYGQPPTILMVDIEGQDYEIIEAICRNIKNLPTWILMEDHDKIDFKILAPQFKEVGRIGPSVLLRLTPNQSQINP